MMNRSDETNGDEQLVRLNKALANAGVASRRASEELIVQGRVTVNGTVVEELGTRVNPLRDEVRIDQVVVQFDQSKRYFVLNKPRGVVSTMRDEQGRPDLRAYTEQFAERIYNVGRLDTDTSGLLVLTNDGDLAHRLSHPKFEVSKTYVAKVRGRVTGATIQRLRSGVLLDDGPIAADHAKVLAGASTKESSLVELTLHSGRNRIVRRMLAELGHPVIELVRRSFGPLHLGNLAVGEVRELSRPEQGALLSAPSEAESHVAASTSNGSAGQVTAGRPGDGKGARGVRPQVHGMGRERESGA